MFGLVFPHRVGLDVVDSALAVADVCGRWIVTGKSFSV
jgi:hypothetical protein